MKTKEKMIAAMQNHVPLHHWPDLEPALDAALEVQNAAVDWDHWRRVYAGQAMQGLLSGNTRSPSLITNLANWSAQHADALVAELKREGKE